MNMGASKICIRGSRHDMRGNSLRRSQFDAHLLVLYILPFLVSHLLGGFRALPQCLTLAARTLGQCRPCSGLCRL